jgi:WD40 repeat protein/DNA-binding winged helix-turn-helix (wHTH) protein
MQVRRSSNDMGDSSPEPPGQAIHRVRRLNIGRAPPPRVRTTSGFREFGGLVRLHFGQIAVDPGAREVLRAGRRVELSPKAMELLLALVEARPRALSRSEIHDRLWPDSFVSEASLRQVAMELRRALGDDPREPRLIRTVRRFGYAFSGTPHEERFQGAHELALALDAMLEEFSGSATEPDRERSPYPGLSSFTERDAAVFFGREAEVEALWERIRSRKLLAVIGPSGAGKTSFLRSGVIPSRPDGWATIVATPGTSPMRGLGQALGPALAADTEALSQLAGFEDPETAFALLSRWRRSHLEVLVAVDQFEELFTLNAPETQARFAALLGRLAGEGGVHVLLSLRDDFLIRCCEQASLAPVLAQLTALLPLGADALRRALVEPARKRGCRFEDEALVEEMVEAVEGARAALPLLAFAVSRLWERRDREKRLLTHEAYQEIGGITGALAQHAEATLDRIGGERQVLVRELFRNLVTAQGTRVVIDRDELLSAFPEPAAAEAVLRQLIDARLVTSYEVEGKEGEPGRHRVELVHESLLTAWPRLVRWQTQDEDGAQLRDQLKQAAHLWDEKGRTSDLLWTGTAYQEYELWRARYAGALTALEEDFARSMAEKARRKKRLLAATVASVIVVLTGVTIAISVSGHRAHVAARRAEASKLLALAQLKLQEDPTEALALATASLEQADTKEVRVFATRALWEAPPALELIGGGDLNVRLPAFSPDGRWLAAAGVSTDVTVWSEDAGDPVTLPGHEPSVTHAVVATWASADLLVTGSAQGSRVRLWSLPAGRLIRTIDFGKASYWQVGPKRLLAETFETGVAEQPSTGLLRSWVLPDGGDAILGRADWERLGTRLTFFAPDGRSWLYARGRDLYARPLPVGTGPDRLIDRSEADVADVGVTVIGPDRLVVTDKAGGIRVLSFPPQGGAEVRVIAHPDNAPGGAWPDRSGRWLQGDPSTDQQVRLWDLGAWPAARPCALRRSGTWFSAVSRFHPTGDWVVASTANFTRLTFWPLTRARPFVVDGYSNGLARPVAFSLDGKWLATSWGDERLRLWPLPRMGITQVRRLQLPENPAWTWLAFDPGGRYLAAVGAQDRAWIAPLDGSPPQKVQGFSENAFLWGAAVSPSGRLVATGLGEGQGPRTLRVWNVESRELRLFDLPESRTHVDRHGTVEAGISSLVFADESTLYTAGDGGLYRWNLDKGSHDVVAAARPGNSMFAGFSADGRTALTTERRRVECAEPVLRDLATGTSRPLPEFGDCVLTQPALDRSGTVAATGSLDGTVRVGRLSGGEPHLLLGHKGNVDSVAISPDLRWIASTGEDNTLRLWPMPDLDKPPLHTLPHDELLAKLRSLTNLRAVRDAESSTGWKIEVGPFPGWKEVPSW